MAPAILVTLAALYVVLEILARGGILRVVWRLLALLFVEMELLAMALVRRLHPPRFVLAGGCHKRGVCCTQIVGDPPRWIKRSLLLGAWIAMHRVLHNFHPVGSGPDGAIIFRCGHLLASGRCGIYRFRPFICRNYPVMPFYRPPPILPGCGYVAVPRVVTAMRTRPTLAVLNARVAVHHPSPIEPGMDLPQHYELVEEVPTPRSLAR